MLTINWRKPDGSEVIFTASSLERSAGSEAQVPAGGDFTARGVDIYDLPGDEFRFSISEPFGAVFVMNEKGQTVARYTTWRPDCGRSVERA